METIYDEPTLSGVSLIRLREAGYNILVDEALRQASLQNLTYEISMEDNIGGTMSWSATEQRGNFWSLVANGRFFRASEEHPEYAYLFSQIDKTLETEKTYKVVPNGLLG
jgi:hypothetical protein